VNAQPERSSGVWLALWALVGAVGCSSAPQLASIEQLPAADGQRHPISGSQASLVVPRDFRIVEPTTWVWPLGQNRAIVLRVQRAQEPEAGLQATLDAQVRAIEQQGEAGIERDQMVPVGDLEGRLLEAVELRRRPPQARWVLTVLAEDGVYTLSLDGEAEELRRRQTVLEATLRSLRVPLPKPTP
jgi:hypothetical protein